MRRILCTKITARKGKVIVSQYSPNLNQVLLTGEKTIHCLSKLNARVVAEGGSGTVRMYQFQYLFLQEIFQLVLGWLIHPQ